MSNKINFLFRCNTLTSFERTSSSCVHCSNGQNEPGSSGAPTIQNGYFWAPRVGPGGTGVLGAGIPRYPKSPALLPGGSSRPNSPAEHQGYHEVLGQERREGKGLLLPTTPPKRANSNNNVLGVDGSQQGFQFMKIQTEDGK